MKSISPICFGCEPLGGTDWGDVDLVSIEKAIHKALDLGINFFDTAGVYGLGLSEERLSKILGNRRHDVIIATKGGLSWKESRTVRSVVIKDSSPIAIRKDVESSLVRLRLECLPIFFVHWPDINTPIEDTFIELLKLKKEGKIKTIGCSNFSAQQLKRACLISKIDYVQLPINILNTSLDKNIAEICKKNKIQIVAYNVLLNGLLTGKFNRNTNFQENDRRSRLPLFRGINFIDVLEKVENLKLKAAENNSNITNYAINWVLKQKNICSVVIGIKNSEQIAENYSIITDRI
tara:strand:+ start:1691 stop:2566 length:876 start_codon:yes stop_codon:yes gene_type:complete